jgi:hypothetical protein
MRRRAFIALVGGASAAWPFIAIAQPAKKVLRMGWLSTGPQSRAFDAFKQGLAEFGYVEGTHVIIEFRHAGSKVERFPALAQELVGLNLDLIVATNSPGPQPNEPPQGGEEPEGEFRAPHGDGVAHPLVLHSRREQGPQDEGIMRRRELLAGLAGVVAARPLAAGAQNGVPVIGFLSSASPDLHDSLLQAFREGLRETGYVEGRNVAIEYRWANGQNERLPALAAELVSREVSVIAAPAFRIEGIQVEWYRALRGCGGNLSPTKLRLIETPCLCLVYGLTAALSAAH